METEVSRSSGSSVVIYWPLSTVLSEDKEHLAHDEFGTNGVESAVAVLARPLYKPTEPLNL